MANKFPLILNTSANQIQEIASGDNLDLTGCKIVGLQGINSAGIVTFTKAHVGAATTWGEDLVVTGNARVTGILTVGTNSVTISGNDVNITGVTTSANFKTGTSNLHNVGLEIAGINVLGADTPIGTGATIYNSGAAVFTGIVTAANYVGTINTPAQPNITSVGTLSSLDVSGNVSIGGTLTYEDVTNIDAVGLISARNGINVSGGNAIVAGMLDVDGPTHLDYVSISGVTTAAGAVDINADLDVDGHTELDNVNIVGVTTFHNDIFMGDSDVLRIGGSSDLQFYHDGNSHVSDRGGGGALWVESNNQVVIKQNDVNHFMAIFNQGGSSELRFNNSKKIETTNTGAVVTGILTATGNVDISHGTGQAHYQITQTSGNTVKFGIVSGSNVEISGSSNNDIVIKRAGATRVTVTSSGVNFGGTDYGFGTTPGGNPAAKNVFLAIGDSDTGIVQDGDGQLELWANNTEVANINAIDGYTSTKPITTTGNVSVGDFTAKSALFTDNGTASPIVDIRSDDGGPWHLQIANDSYSTGSHGLNLHLDNTGIGYIRNLSSSSYKDIKIGVHDGSGGNGTVDTLVVSNSGISVDGNSGVSAKRLTLSDNGASGPIFKVRTDDNSPWALEVGNDTYNNSCGQMWYQNNNGDFYQRVLYTNAGFRDWYFQVSDGSTTNNAIKIDTNRAVTLLYQGNQKLITTNTGVSITGTANVGDNIRVGVSASDNQISAFTNNDSGNSDFSHRGSRTLHSNGTGWDGNGSNDGADPIIVCSVADRAGNSDIGDSLGLLLHSESQDNNDYSPIIGFSNRSNSGSYNTVYAAIAGKKTGQAADHNWSAGQLNFYTAGKGSNRANDQYMDNIPDFFIDRYGYTGTPRMPYFWAWKNASAWSLSANEEFVWDNVNSNIGGHYNTSNGRFYAPKDGFYHFDFNTIFTGGTSINSGWVSIRINGNRIKGGDMHFTQYTSNHWDGTAWSGLLYLAAGQYVSCFAGSAHSYHGGSWSRFSGHMVSSEQWS